MADKKISALTAATTPLAGSEVLPIVQGGSTVKVSIANVTAGRDVGAKNVIATGQGVFAGPLDNFWSASGALYGYYSGGGVFGSYSDAVGTLSPLSFDGSTIALRTANVSRLEVSNGGNVTARTGNFIVGTAGRGIDFSANTHAAGMTSELLNWYEEGTWTPVVFFGGANTGMNVAVSGHYTRIGRLVTVRCSVVFTAKGSSTGTFQISGLPYSGSIPGAGAMGFNYGWATMPSGGMTFAAISGSIYAMPANFGGYADDTYFGNGTAINDITITYMV